MDYNKFIERIFTISSLTELEELSLELFHLQSVENDVYRAYLDLVHIKPKSINKIGDIPYLPIEFFKSQKVVTGVWDAELEFQSSRTTGQVASKHYVKEAEVYHRSFIKGFELAYGSLQETILLCLLPNYQENPYSSLTYMTDKLIDITGSELSGYYLDQDKRLQEGLLASMQSGKRVILFGVSYALLDLAGQKDFPDLKDAIVMETGGMKGNREEMVKDELHKELQKGFGVDTIHSEYGMTELLSQAYSGGGGRFKGPPWVSFSTRDVNDPFKALESGQSGGLNIIDLANVHSCAFLATQDLGKVYSDGSFELLGRFDHSDIRGCNLMIAE